MSLEVVIRNRQRRRRIDVAQLRRVVRALLQDEVGVADGALGIHLVSARAMAELNRRWLHHAGSTDVITFNHAGAPWMRTPRIRARNGVARGRRVSGVGGRQEASRGASGEPPYGELFISVEDAAGHAARFRTTPSSEVVRCIVHGVLHLLGHDDGEAAERRAMKKVENRGVRRLAARFALGGLVGRSVRPAKG